MLTGVGGVPPPPPLQPDTNTNAKAANTNARPSERNLISSPVSSGRLSFSWIVLLGKAQARELWDHSKQKKSRVVSGGVCSANLSWISALRGGGN
jgi:hypothetical protein